MQVFPEVTAPAVSNKRGCGNSGGKPKDNSSSQNASSCILRIFTSLPPDLLHLALPFLDGTALGRWEQTCQAALTLVVHRNEELWHAAAAREYQWFNPVKPSYLSFKQFYVALRKSSWPTEPSMNTGIIADEGVHRPGKLYVVGGSSDRPMPLQTCEFFNDLGGTKKLPMKSPPPFSLYPIAHLHQKRSAPGVARDHEDGVWAVGGWSGSAALNTVERLGVNVKEMMTTKSSADTINRTQDMIPRMQTLTIVHNATTMVTSSSSSTISGGSSSNSNERTTPPTIATTLCRREAQWNKKQELQTARCFLASITDLQGRLYALGGGESIWQGARVLNTTEILDDPLASACAWRMGPAMMEARCGLSAALDTHGHIYVAGGYGGGTRYSSSVEVLRVGDDSEGATRGWLADAVPPMQVARTGFGLAFGPDRGLVAVGGSPDGLHSHRTAERYDDREGRWRWLPRMMTPRGYCAVAFGTSGLLYVVGGEAGDANENARNPVVEIFDPRADRWRAWVGPGDPGKDGMDRVDLGLVWALV
ncbi:hypothetical protein VYU27_001338 [Nannochloropsis oceanica]